MTDKETRFTPPSWDALCGKHMLSGIRTDVRHPFDPDANGIAIDLQSFTVFIFEDPSDGYRSTAAAPLIAACSLYEFGSPQYVHAPVEIRKWERSEGDSFYGEVSGLQFVDTRSNKVILTVGTSNTDDYYPSFVCEWRPENLGEPSHD